MRQKMQQPQSDDSFRVLAKELALKPMAQHPIGFSNKALDPDEESLISDVSRVPGNVCLSKFEIEKCMRDRLVKNRDEILKAMQSIVFSWPGRVKKRKLFEMINGFWIVLTPQQFETLVSDIQEYGDGSIDFRQLFMKIEGKRRLKYGLAVSDKAKYGLPAPPLITGPGLDLILQSKINSNIKEVTRGLRMYQEGNGLIKRQALKKVLDTFAISTKPTQFNNLMRFYDPHNTGYVNIHDFLIQLGTHVRNYVKRNPDQITASSVFNWNEPFFDDLAMNTRRNALKYNKNDPDLMNLSIPEVVIQFEDRIGKNIEDLTKCFLTYDIASSGLVTFQDFRNVLNYFVYPTSESLYREIMQKLPVNSIGGMVAWEQFLETIKQKVSASPKQQSPVVHRWNKDPHQAIWTKTTSAEICKCGDLTNLLHPMTLKIIMEKLRKYNIVPGPVTRKIFTVRTNVGERLITRSDFKLFLGRRCCILSEREMTDLLNLLDPDHTNRITYNRFQTLFCENPPVISKNNEKDEIQEKKDSQWCQPKYDLAETAVTNMAACFPDLSPEDAIIKLRRHMHKNWAKFSKMRKSFFTSFSFRLTNRIALNHHLQTVLARAHGRSGSFIYQEELRLILDVFVMQLTDIQWQHLLKTLGITTGQINAQYFLDSFAILDVEALERWNRTVYRLFGDDLRKTTPPEDELERRLLTLIENRGKEIHYDLVKLDPKSFGFVGRKGFRKLMTKYMPDLSDDGFDDLWTRLPTNEFNNFDYEWFLRKYKHFYAKPPEHRCQCECDYAHNPKGWKDKMRGYIVGTDENDSTKANRSDDEGEGIAYRLLAGGMQADKKPEVELIVPSEKKTENSPSTSNNTKVMAIVSESSVRSVDVEGVVHVPFRPPTPPKHQLHKDSTVGPLVVQKNEDNEHHEHRSPHPEQHQYQGHNHHQGQHTDEDRRQSAGMDLRYHPFYTELCEESERTKSSNFERKSQKSTNFERKSQKSTNFERKLQKSSNFERKSQKSSNSERKSSICERKLNKCNRDLRKCAKFESYSESSVRSSASSQPRVEKLSFEGSTTSNPSISSSSIKSCPCHRRRTASSSGGVLGEELLKKIVNSKWREMRLELNKLDFDGLGEVKNEQFRSCLVKHGVPMTVEMDEILKKYSVPNTGPVNYLQFLQAFVIHLQPEEVTVTARRNFQQVPPVI
uniref:EF-hand domain-containing protein n=1 Tax=Strigamia maritima TaxID=126957 RepID=T1IPF1_STRMM